AASGATGGILPKEETGRRAVLAARLRTRGGNLMRVAVILSTYSQPVWLEKVVWGYSVQSSRLFEVVVADDGSTEETAEMLVRVGDATGLDIRHVWHEDRGFRKCRILNQAIVESTGEYLIFSDGDCIPSQDFVATHLEFA